MAFYCVPTEFLVVIICALTALPLCALHFHGTHSMHCAFMVLYKCTRDAVTSWRNPYNLRVDPTDSDLCACPWSSCRRPYCAAMVILQRSYQNAKRRRLFYACSKCAPSLSILCNPNVSTGDATALVP